MGQSPSQLESFQDHCQVEAQASRKCMSDHDFNRYAIRASFLHTNQISLSSDQKERNIDWLAENYSNSTETANPDL